RGDRPAAAGAGRGLRRGRGGGNFRQIVVYGCRSCQTQRPAGRDPLPLPGEPPALTGSAAGGLFFRGGEVRAAGKGSRVEEQTGLQVLVATSGGEPRRLARITTPFILERAKSPRGGDAKRQLWQGPPTQRAALPKGWHGENTVHPATYGDWRSHEV